MDDLFAIDNETSIGILICCTIFLALSYYYKKYPPKEINELYGFRTRRTMANQDIWEVANRRAAQDMWRYSIALTIVGLLLILFKIPYAMLIFLIALLAGLGVSVLSSLRYLDRFFDKNGNRL